MQANFFHNGKYWELKEGKDSILSHLIIEQIPLNVVLNFVEGIDKEEEFEELTVDQQKDVLEQFRKEIFPTELFGQYLLDNMKEMLEEIRD